MATCSSICAIRTIEGATSRRSGPGHRYWSSESAHGWPPPHRLLLADVQKWNRRTCIDGFGKLAVPLLCLGAFDFYAAQFEHIAALGQRAVLNFNRLGLGLRHLELGIRLAVGSRPLRAGLRLRGRDLLVFLRLHPP